MRRCRFRPAPSSSTGAGGRRRSRPERRPSLAAGAEAASSAAAAAASAASSAAAARLAGSGGPPFCSSHIALRGGRLVALLASGSDHGKTNMSLTHSSGRLGHLVYRMR